jgi:phospholipid/cholesterol/gamma-HCH transport system ATP-binding protein
VTKGPVRDLSFNFESGGTAKILFDSEDRKNILFGLLAGLQRPEAGRILFFGEDLFAHEENERLALFRRIGVVPAHGGLISNLKAWENLLLPAWYHRGLTANWPNDRWRSYSISSDRARPG